MNLVNMTGFNGGKASGSFACYNFERNLFRFKRQRWRLDGVKAKIIEI